MASFRGRVGANLLAMNKSIKYLGFSFLGGLLLFTLGALRPFIASENGLAFGLTASNAVMVGSFRSMSGSVTNICADFAAPQHVRIMPQTANTGEFDIGDPAQATGRYLMFSKPAGAFLLGHDGTDAFRVNVANGYVTMPGGSLFGDGTGGIFELNANAQFEIDPLGQMLLNGDDTVASHRSEIFLHGTNAHIRLDLGAAIEDWTAVTHLTMAPGSASLDGGKFIGNGAGLTNLNGDSLARNTLFTNENVTHYLLTNEVLGTYIAWIPGVGLVKSNTITHAATLIVGTNGGAHYGGWTPAGAGNVVVDGQFIGNGAGLTNLSVTSGPTTSNNIPTGVTWFGTAPATNVLIDLSLGTLFRFRATNNFTLIFTNGVDGEDFSVSIYQDATGNRTCPVLLSNNTGGTQTNRVAFGSDITGITLTTNALYWDHIKARFNVGTAGIPNTTNKIDILGFVRGYN